MLRNNLVSAYPISSDQQSHRRHICRRTLARQPRSCTLRSGRSHNRRGALLAAVGGGADGQSRNAARSPFNVLL